MKTTFFLLLALVIPVFAADNTIYLLQGGIAVRHSLYKVWIAEIIPGTLKTVKE